MAQYDLQAGAILCFDKPYGWTSFDLVNKFRYQACRHMGIKKLKVGHAGTLDPLATGVMIVCTGRSTKQIEQLQAGTKEYLADLCLGATTPSFDLEHPIDATYPYEHITEEQVREVLISRFIGCIEQIPPSFSAVKMDGKRSYELARKGEDVKLKPKQLVINEIELLKFDLPHITLRVVCSKGTYIRALARDIGEALGSGAHLTALKRTKVGAYTLQHCHSMEGIEQFVSEHVMIPEKETDTNNKTK